MTLWLAIGYRLFGIQSPLGWHLANLALHLGVLAVAQALLRRLGATPTLTAAILLVFAVHTTRVESVTWISGFQDPLAGLFVLGALAALLGSTSPSPRNLPVISLVLYTLALLVKETAIAFPVVVFVAGLSGIRLTGANASLNVVWRSIRFSLPFVLLTGLYIVARIAVLGFFFSGVSSAPVSANILTFPAEFAFYVGQALLPLTVGPVHALRPVTLATVGLLNFWLPLAASLLGLAALIWISRRSPLRITGLAIFLALLAPTLPISRPPDATVQDRYLYIPLLGFLTVVLPALAGGLVRFARISLGRAEKAVLGLALAAAVPLGMSTARYARAWSSDAALWEWGLGTDPGSPIALGQTAVWRYRAGRLGEAKELADRAVLADPAQQDAILTLARVAESDRHLGNAEQYYRRAVRFHPEVVKVWEELAAFYQRHGQLLMSEKVLLSGRDRFPRMRAAFTDNLASVLHELGRTEEALRELEAVRPIVRNEFHPAAPSVLFHIGLMNLELGRIGEARTALLEFLDASARADDPEIQRRRGEAAAILSRLTRPAVTGGLAAPASPTPPPASPK